MFDKIEKLHHSIVQHGPNNDRIYLMKLDERDLPGIMDTLHDLSIAKRYTKIFAKVPEHVVPAFLNKGYKEEATIPGLNKGNETVHFVSRFFSSQRSFIAPDMQSKLRKSMDVVQRKKHETKKLIKPEGISIRKLEESDIPSLAGLYRKVFRVYPFPIFDEDYLAETITNHIRYFGAFIGDQLIAAASAEVDVINQNAEMTDFATLPDFLGKNISYFLLIEMEKAMNCEKLKTVYTIARAQSIGMNATFARRDYTFSGMLVNNTLIGDSIESMNVWYKTMVPVH